MAKYGKWIGGGLGWVLGGPIGVILGFVLGSMFDAMQSGDYEYQGTTTQPGDFGVSLLVLTAAVMKADEKVMKSELDYVRAFLQRQFGEEKGEQLILILRDLLKRDINIQQVSIQIRHYMDHSSRLQLIHFLFGIALADGQSHLQELQVIRTICGYLGVSDADYESIQAMFVKNMDSAYQILEILPEASDEEVHKAYRRMAVKYHPDKVSHLGEDVQRAAKEKFQQLNQAYQDIKRHRGLK
ncbi:MAG: TerB family tellurite resistance protein [Bacteroidales bacterium]|nr:TerB family tellurite resistance protein [Lentimicrobiaceae bacterium]MDD5695394.1 TerB family tellurite resistance protein [Bacteroidales bacterium]